MKRHLARALGRGRHAHLFRLKPLPALLIQLLIHLLKHLPHIAGQTVHSRVPVAARIGLQRWKDPRQYLHSRSALVSAPLQHHDLSTPPAP